MGYESVVNVNFWTALFTLCNMIISFLFLGKFLLKPIKKMIDSRQQEIDEIYAQAEDSREQARKSQAEYEERLSSARTEAHAITTRAMESARDRSDAMLRAAEEEASRMREKAEADIALERRKAMGEMKGEISDLAVMVASKVVQKEIDPATHEELIERFIDELGE